MENYLLISDAAKEVQVESHVLRYWEEELRLPIRRNELGHRYYTQEDIERFKNIKSMKERGLQLKAIKMILKNGKLDVLTQGGEEQQGDKPQDGNPQGDRPQEDKQRGEMRQDVKLRAEELQRANNAQLEPIVDMKDTDVLAKKGTHSPESREEKAQRLQWIMQQMIREAVRENNAEMVRQIKECVLKELDYQFRMQEDRQEERAREAAERTESYYRQMDELLRKKSSKNIKAFLGKKQEDKKAEKKKKHFAT